MTITRTMAGLLFRDQFARAPSQVVGNGWTEHEANAGEMTIVAGEVIHFDIGQTSPNRFLRRTVDHSADFLVQFQMEIPVTTGGSQFSGAGIFIRGLNQALGSFGTCYLLDHNRLQADRIDLYRIAPGLALVASANLDLGTIRRVRLTGEHSDGDLIIRGYSHPISSLQDLTGDMVPGVTPSFQYLDVAPVIGDGVGWRGQLGLGFGINIDADEFLVCGRTISVTGLPTGYKVQIDGRAAATETAGSVTFAVDEWALPAATIRILDPSSVEVEALTPSGGIWGGDVFLFELIVQTNPWSSPAAAAGTWAPCEPPAAGGWASKPAAGGSWSNA